MASAAQEPTYEVDEQPEPQQDEEADILSDTQSLRVKKHRAHAASGARIARRAALVVVCTVIIVALAIVALFEVGRISHERERLAEQERVLNTPRPVEVVLGIPPSDTTHDMPVAIRVTGTTQKGTKVDETQVVSLDEPNLLLMPGAYTARLEGDSLSSDGTLYRGSTDTFDFDVSADSLSLGNEEGQHNQEKLAQDDAESNPEDESSQEAQVAPVFAFAVVPPQNVADEDLESVRSWLEATGSDPAPYVEAATARRAEAIERIRADGEARDNEQMSQVEGIVGYVNEQLYAREVAKAEEEKKKESASDDTSQTNEQQEEDKQ